jgi:hypothetical protein
MMRARSVRFSTVFGLAVVALLLPLRGIFAEIISTNIYILNPGQTQAEDVYVAANTARVDGIIDGDLVISTGSVEIGGTVTGDVLVLSSGPVEVTGTIEGSLRGFARNVTISGSVGNDVTVSSMSLGISGTVSRDVLFFGGSLDMSGDVGRNVNGRMITALLNGKVGHDVDIAVSSLTVDGATVVDGDLLYRSSVNANIAATVQVGGQSERLPTRGGWGVELVLTVATIIGFLGFVFAGIVLIWLFRRTAPRSIDYVSKSPWRAAGVGLLTLLVAPIVVVVLMMTLVGVPVALVVMLLLVLGLFFGPIPAVTAAGSKLVRGRWGLFAAFVIGAVIWRIGIWLIPIVGVGLYLGSLVIGVGGWVMGVLQERREAPLSVELLPVARRKPTPAQIPTPVGWEAPLAPGSRSAVDEETVVETHEYTTPGDEDEPEA